ASAIVTPILPQPPVIINDVSVTEGNPGATNNAVISVTLPRPANQQARISYNTFNGTATGGQDYIATSGIVTIPTGAMSAQFSVPIIGDLLLGTEQFSIFFLNLTPGVVTLPDIQAIVTINDDDPASPLTSNGRFVSQVFVDVLGGPVNVANLNFFTSQLNFGQTREQVALGILNSVGSRQ